MLRAVQKYGFAGLTYRVVAGEAGVTHGLVGYHFRSLDAMIEEALVLAADETIRDSRMAMPAGDLPAFAKSVGTLVSKQAEPQSYRYELTFEARRRPELAGQVRTLYENYYGVVEQALVALGPLTDRALIRLVFAALDGLVLQQLIFDDGRATRASIEWLQELLTMLARPEGSRGSGDVQPDDRSIT